MGWNTQGVCYDDEHENSEGTAMKQEHRMRLLVCDTIDTMSRMSDHVMKDSAEGISDHLEDILLNSADDRVNDICASSLVVILAIMKPLTEQMLASTDGRYSRSRIDIDDESIDPERADIRTL